MATILLKFLVQKNVDATLNTINLKIDVELGEKAKIKKIRISWLEKFLK